MFRVIQPFTVCESLFDPIDSASSETDLNHLEREEKNRLHSIILVMLHSRNL